MKQSAIISYAHGIFICIWKQLNKDTIYHVILKTSKSLSKKTLQETLSNDQKLKIKLHYAKNSNNIEKKCFKEDKNIDHVVENIKDLFRWCVDTAKCIN